MFDVAVALAAGLGEAVAVELADFGEGAAGFDGFADVAEELLASTLAPPPALSDPDAVALGFGGPLLVELAPPGAAAPDPEDAAGV